MNKYTFVVEKENGFKAIDFLKSKGISKEIIQKVKYGNVYLNNQKLNNINEKVHVGDTLHVLLPQDQINLFVKPVNAPLDIVYQDDYMIAVNKGSGVLTHNSKGNDIISLDQMVCGYFAPTPFTFRAINRLDRDTSGIVLIAKDMISASFLGDLMKSGGIKKTYSAMVVGKPEKDHFFIEKPIKRQSEGSMKRVIDEQGQYAKSECWFVKDLSNGLSLIDITLHTGRTHQIRVHLSSVGLPLYADSLYGQKVEGKTYLLHAKSLEFIHPFTNEKITLFSPIKL